MLFVKSQNACLKHLIESSNISLYELGRVLINNINNNTKQKQYEELIRVGQMKESVYYISFHSNIEEIKNMPVSKLSKSDNFENELDSVFLCAQFLLQQLDCTKIEELFYGEVWKLVHTAVDKYVIHQDHTFVEIIKSYLTSINLREEENSNQQVNYSENEESNNENTFPNISIRNLRKVATRGRPKLSSHYNNNQNQHLRNKPLLDEKRCQNYCSYCKKIGHNVATCSKKAEDQQI
ncbi:hypothetical protein C2G38_2163710 [Gigaspora rosea]|uniref:Uncharacterized protein n=1 Tax=Gigaspora rosea TaxID=44941 RepID=A0A397VWW9_9GLOM|nr:hypothetical protein C2G38_2163710 [Gigaspora rosea]